MYALYMDYPWMILRNGEFAYGVHIYWWMKFEIHELTLFISKMHHIHKRQMPGVCQWPQLRSLHPTTWNSESLTHCFCNSSESCWPCAILTSMLYGWYLRVSQVFVYICTYVDVEMKENLGQNVYGYIVGLRLTLTIIEYVWINVHLSMYLSIHLSILIYIIPKIV